MVNVGNDNEQSIRQFHRYYVSFLTLLISRYGRQLKGFFCWLNIIKKLPILMSFFVELIERYYFGVKNFYALRQMTDFSFMTWQNIFNDTGL